jgi:hypothetical protein
MAERTFEQRDMSGALFKNERKTQPNQPDFQGKIKVEGTDWWVSAWVKTAQASGKQYLSLAISEPMQNAGSPVGAADSLLGGVGPSESTRMVSSGLTNRQRLDDDDIPF